jgi:very-short-patch-repair endonuclease
MFYPKNLQTQNEIAFFEKLKYIFQKDYHIATQVALSAIVKTDNYKERSQFNTYYVDFVICDKKGEKPLLIIELDDYSHESEKRKNQDKRKNGVIQSAGIPFIRYNSKPSYNISDIANNTIPYLNGNNKTPIYETLPINKKHNNSNYNLSFFTPAQKIFKNIIKTIIIIFLLLVFIILLALISTAFQKTQNINQNKKIPIIENNNIEPNNITKNIIKETQKSIKFDAEKYKNELKKKPNIILPKYYPNNETKNENNNQSNKNENDNIQKKSDNKKIIKKVPLPIKVLDKNQ